MTPRGVDDEVWGLLEGLRNRPIVAESRDYAERVHATSLRRKLSHWRRVEWRIAVATAIVAVSLIAFEAFDRTMEVARGELQTGVGQVQSFSLTDGSTVMLDTDSRLRFVLEPDARRIDLIQGQAHFEVAKDRSRPFRVRAGLTEVVAVGTIFDVARLPTRTTITLIEGGVDVRRISIQQGAQDETERLGPGQQLSVQSDGHLLAKHTVPVSTVTAWQRQAIEFDDIPLADALAEVNRYSSTKIVVADPTLASRRISGEFHTGDTKAFVAALERYFGLKAEWHSDQGVTLDRK